MKLILATTSKFKSDILTRVGLKHTCKGSIENHNILENPYEYVKNQAYTKAKYLDDEKETDEIIIGLDNITIINNKIVEKPSSIEEARQNIENCSNSTVRVICGVSIINKKTKEIINDYAETIVTFRNIAKEDIDYYLENEQDAMYVSGFVLETYMSNYIKEIKGSYYNILGAPVEKIYEILNKWNIKLKDIN